MALSSLLTFLILAIFAQTRAQLPPDTYDGCFVDKGCIGDSAECVGLQNCRYLLTYVKIDEGNEWSFQYSAAVTDSEEYVAVGWSFGDTIMDEDLVVSCYSTQGDPGDFAHMYWNDDKVSAILPDDTFALSNISGSVTSGIASCSFNMLGAFVVVNPVDGAEYIIDLENRKYFVMFAKGPLSDQDTMDFHTERTANYEIEVDFNVYEDQTPTEPPPTDDPALGHEEDYVGCGVTRGCFGSSFNCTAYRNCTSFASYVANDDGSVDFTLTGYGFQEDNYVAFGLTEESGMHEASVVYCFAGDGNSIQVSNCWTPEDPIRDCLVLDDPLIGISGITGSLVDGKLVCSFTRDRVTDIQDPDSGAVTRFDLAEDYYFLAAWGPMDERSSDPLQIDQHFDRNGSSELMSLDVSS